VLHSCTSDRRGTEGDFKLYGRARDVRDDDTRGAYRAAIRARIDWEPADPFHLFAIDVEAAGYVVFGERRFAQRVRSNSSHIRRLASRSSSRR
jgi:hypothetical protein